MTTAVTLFRIVPKHEQQVFINRAAEDCVGAELADMGALATDPLYHPIYRREVARRLYLALDDIAQRYESES